MTQTIARPLFKTSDFLRVSPVFDGRFLNAKVCAAKNGRKRNLICFGHNLFCLSNDEQVQISMRKYKKILSCIDSKSFR